MPRHKGRDQAFFDAFAQGLLNGTLKLHEYARANGVGIGTASAEMKKRGLSYIGTPKNSAHWVKGAALNQNGQTVAAADSSLLLPEPSDPDDRSLYDEIQQELSRATATVNAMYDALAQVAAERDNANARAQLWEADATKLLEDLEALTRRYEDQGREVLVLREQAKKYASMKHQQDLNKIAISNQELQDAQQRARDYAQELLSKKKA